MDISINVKLWFPLCCHMLFTRLPCDHHFLEQPLIEEEAPEFPDNALNEREKGPTMKELQALCLISRAARPQVEVPRMQSCQYVPVCILQGRMSG